MYDLKCKHCGAPIMEYHAPDQRDLLRKHVRSALRCGVTREEVDQIVDEESQAARRS